MIMFSILEDKERKHAISFLVACQISILTLPFFTVMSHRRLNLRMLSSSSPRGPLTLTIMDLMVTVTVGVEKQKKKRKKEWSEYFFPI